MLLWFRNDLRTHDNPALHYVLSNVDTEKKSASAIFFISHKQWKKHHWSEIKIDFIVKHARNLVEELASLGISLSLIYADSFKDQISYIIDHVQQHAVNEVVANSEVEFNEQQRDQALLEQGVKLTLFEADVIVPKGKVLNKSGSMFKVFTPFKRAWLAHVQANGFSYLGKAQAIKRKAIKNLDLEHKVTSQPCKGVSKAWPVARIYEHQVFPAFIDKKLSLYGEQRDIPSIKGTSGISPYLAAGLISPRYVLRQLLNKYPDLLFSVDSPYFSWLNELIWREFYRHLLFDQPRLCKHQCFNLKYQSINWDNNAEYFEAWKQGRTGYPLIDAAMRQLSTLGWMHNRLRMVVASFLTKHLLIDWRWGEKYFMQHLIDGDLAANNGGWQWAASTGCDAQPYFRVFNPIRQSERFDPKGDFIRTYLPELKDIPDSQVHFPHQYIAKHTLNLYWPAIVEHKQAREKAMAFYQSRPHEY
ncbi:MAG: deoxyribodipyrimidine photo-lyase [Litorilituus sp.]|nr:deoxyribodipyrimidine photo-lyase [Litorilituus sp.]